jgi:poly(3-hydroxybutyrate) depolymerase
MPSTRLKGLSFVLACVLGLGRMITGAAQEPPTDDCKNTSTSESLVVNGVVRTYVLYVPCGFRPRESALLVAMHGRSGTGAGFEASSHLDEKANREGFAVVYPDALIDSVGSANWNYYYDPFFFTNAPDDVGFVRALIDLLRGRLRPDPRRIYVTGTSAGGFMAQTLGVALSDRVAAIGVVEGGISVITPASPQSVPNATAPISVLMLKGDQDGANFYCGTVFTQFGVVESSADQDFSYWTGPAGNSCTRIDTNAPFCSSVGTVGPNGTTFGQPTAVVEKEARGCKDHVEVKVYRLIGGVDRWNLDPMNVPGQIPYNPDLNAHTGVTTNDIVWNFFARHPKRSDGP